MRHSGHAGLVPSPAGKTVKDHSIGKHFLQPPQSLVHTLRVAHEVAFLGPRYLINTGPCPLDVACCHTPLPTPPGHGLNQTILIFTLQIWEILPNPLCDAGADMSGFICLLIKCEG